MILTSTGKNSTWILGRIESTCNHWFVEKYAARGSWEESTKVQGMPVLGD